MKIGGGRIWNQIGSGGFLDGWILIFLNEKPDNKAKASQQCQISIARNHTLTVTRTNNGLDSLCDNILVTT